MNSIKIILILSFILYKAFDWYLAYLDTRHMDAQIPENVRDVYNEEEYRNWIAYHREKKRIGIAESAVSFLIELLMLAFNFYAFVFKLFGSQPLYLQYFLAILLLTTIDTVISIPFSY